MKPPQARRGRVDLDKIDSASEHDIRQHAVEDGEDPAASVHHGTLVLPPRHVREQLGLTQVQFSARTGIPIATLRNWEQGRTKPDPAARALLLILLRDPKGAMKALGAKRA